MSSGSCHNGEDLNILSGQTSNNLIHSASFELAHWVCDPAFAEKVRRCFVCLDAFAGSSECKDMDQSERESRKKNTTR